MLRSFILTLLSLLFLPSLYAETACRDYRTSLNEANSLVVVAGEGLLPSIDYKGTADTTFTLKGVVCNLDLAPLPRQDLRLVRFADTRPKDGKQALSTDALNSFQKLDEFEISSKKDGGFLVTGLPPGSYALMARNVTGDAYVVYDLRIVPGFTIPSSSALGVDPAPLSTISLY